MVNYVINHPKLTPAQRAWGFMLGLFCVREEYPEGVSTFDEFIDKGGDDLKLEKTTESAPDKIDSALEGPLFDGAAEFAELFAKYVSKTKRGIGLSNPQAAYGLGRALHNLRSTFPEENGGPVGFDHWASEASAYYKGR